MRIKKFTAGSMREALMQIKDELGEEAIILKTRKLPKKVFALGSHDEVEVTAAIDETAAPEPQLPPISVTTGVYSRPRVSGTDDPDRPGNHEIKKWEPPENGGTIIIEDERMAQAPRRTGDRRDQQEILELRESVRELREMVAGIMNGATPATPAKGGEFSGGWAVLHRKLLNSEVKPSIAETLIRQLSSANAALSDTQAEKKLISALISSLPVAGPLKLKKNGPLVVIFVGPTGAGKTTTLAKLAAHCRISRRKRVSILTADTYRIAAIDQIRTFTDIIKVGLQVIFSPEEAAQAIRGCSGDDIVFIDTAGRSQRNGEHMDHLRELLAVLGPDEIHLVLSATTKDSDLLECIERYRPLGVNRLLFTKLDETGQIGNIFNAVHQSGIPVSYFTSGQSVPDDIEAAQASRLLQRLLGNGAS